MENTEELRRFAEASKDYTFGPGEGLPGSVWARKEALWHQDIVQEELSLIVRFEEFKRSGLRSLWAIPVQQSPVSIVITNRQGSIEFINPRFTQVTGYTPEDALGKDPSVMKSGKHSKQFYRDLWKTIQKGKVWTGEFITRKKTATNIMSKPLSGQCSTNRV